MSVAIKEMGENAQIVHLGDFFRYNDHKNPSWFLSIWCNPIQNKKSSRAFFNGVFCFGKGQLAHGIHRLVGVALLCQILRIFQRFHRSLCTIIKLFECVQIIKDLICTN